MPGAIHDALLLRNCGFAVDCASDPPPHPATAIAVANTPAIKGTAGSSLICLPPDRVSAAALHAERQSTLVERFTAVDLVKYTGADIAAVRRSDENHAGILAVSLSLDRRHEGAIEDLECTVREFLAALNQRRRAA